MPKFPFCMPFNKWFIAKEMVMLCNIMSWIMALSICLLEYVLWFDCLLLLKQSNYNEDGWVNIPGLAKIWEALPNWCYNEFKRPPDT